MIVAVNCLLAPATEVDGDTVIVNGFGITIVAFAAGAMSPTMSMATKTVAIRNRYFDERVRRIGGILLMSHVLGNVVRRLPAEGASAERLRKLRQSAAESQSVGGRGLAYPGAASRLGQILPFGSFPSTRNVICHAPREVVNLQMMHGISRPWWGSSAHSSGRDAVLVRDRVLRAPAVRQLRGVHDLHPHLLDRRRDAHGPLDPLPDADVPAAGRVGLARDPEQGRRDLDLLAGAGLRGNLDLRRRARGWRDPRG